VEDGRGMRGAGQKGGRLGVGGAARQNWAGRNIVGTVRSLELEEWLRYCGLVEERRGESGAEDRKGRRRCGRL